MKRENLLVVNGVVWAIAGVNVLRIGIMGLIALGKDSVWWVVLALLGAAVIFAGFHVMFSRIVIKNSARIRALEGERQNPLRFLDAKGYLIMAIMMGGGFGFRAAGLIPDWFVAFFYTGLGLALTLAGVAFFMYRGKEEGWRFHRKHALQPDSAARTLE